MSRTWTPPPLEQERVGFAAIERALAGLQDGPALPLPVEWASGPTDRR